jgi:hypothetical protein
MLPAGAATAAGRAGSPEQRVDQLLLDDRQHAVEHVVQRRAETVRQ